MGSPASRITGPPAPAPGEVGGPLSPDQWLKLTNLAVSMGLGVITSRGGALSPGLMEILRNHPEFHRAAEAAIGGGIDVTGTGHATRLTFLGPDRLHEGSDRLHGPPTPASAPAAGSGAPRIPDRIRRDLENGRTGDAGRIAREAASAAGRVREHGMTEQIHRPATQADLDTVGPVAKRVMPDEDFSFLDDPNMSLEEKLMLFMAKLADKRDAEIRELLGELSGQEKAGGAGGGAGEAGGGGRSGGGFLGAFKAIATTAATIVGAVKGGPAGAQVGAMAGNMFGQLVDGIAGGGGGSRGTVEVNAPGGGVEGAEGKKRGENEILQRIQYLQGKFDRINTLVTNFLQSSHNSRMAVLNNLRG
jgi:hypothetical protein